MNIVVRVPSRFREENPLHPTWIPSRLRKIVHPVTNPPFSGGKTVFEKQFN
jgi:hypothetical protein